MSSGARPKLLILLLLLPPLLWLGIVYLGSLFALLLQSFFSHRRFLRPRSSTSSRSRPMRELFKPANLDIILRTVTMAALVTLASRGHRLSHRLLRGALCRAAGKALFYLAVMLPLWSSYLVKVYAWKLILAKEGILTWLAKGLHLLLAARRHPGAAGDRRQLAVGSAISAPSSSSSMSGCPYMILPIQAALERVPRNLHRGLGRSRRAAAARPSAT